MKRFKWEYSLLSDSEKNLESKGHAKIVQNYKTLADNKCIYLWGDPGCGKSFIAETFFDNLAFND